MNSIIIITDGYKSFSITTPGHWYSEDGDKLIKKLNRLLELRSQNYFEDHVEQVRKKEQI